MMMGFAWLFVFFGAMSALFVAWPLLSKKNTRQNQSSDEITGRIAFNNAVFAEQLQELDDQLGRAEISQARYDKLKSELELQNQHDTDIESTSSTNARPSRSKSFLLASALVVPLCGWFIYAQLGAADDVRIQRLNNQLVQLQQSGDTAAIQAVNRELSEVLQARLQKQPDNLNNRFLLARTAVEMRDFPLALESYGYILEREPNSPAVLGETAQVLFIAAGNRFTAEVQQLFDRALELDPNNGELLGFAGVAAYQSGRFDAAIAYWERGKAQLEPDDPRYQSWEDVIGQARSLAGESAPEVEQEAASKGVTVEVEVSLAPGVEASPEARVFVYARAWEGPRAPLAMQQLQVSQLPATVTLDESMSMVPNLTMSRFSKLEIVARVSLSGSAEPQSGDWQGMLGPVDSGKASESIQVIIDSQVR